MTTASFHISRLETHRLILRTLVSYIGPDNTRSNALAKRLGATLDSRGEPPQGPPCQVWRHQLRDPR